MIVQLTAYGLPLLAMAGLRYTVNKEAHERLTWNAHLILGFLNFISAIPLALFGLALAARLRQEFTPRRAVGLAVVSTLTFYTHVVPFAFLGLGAALMLVGDGPRETLRRWLAQEGTSYRALLEEFRQMQAAELAQIDGMKTEEIAFRLGYSEAAGYLHARRRWSKR